MRQCNKFLVCTVALISTFGCRHGPPRPEPQRDEDIRSVARSALVGLNLDTLRVDVTVLNTAKTPRAFVIRPCFWNPLVLKVQRDGRIWESTAWERERMKAPEVRDSTGKVIPQVFTCSGIMMRQLLPRRSVLAYSSSTAVRNILGDSLPPGRYHIRASFWLNERGIKTISAGEVELRLPPT